MEHFIEAIPDPSQRLEEPALSPENSQTDPVSDLSADTCTFLTSAMIQDPYPGAASGQRSLSEEKEEERRHAQHLSPLWLIWEQFVNDLCTERTLQ